MKLHLILAAALSATCAFLNLATTAHAQIPASERAVLQALYTGTTGANWTNNTNWNGAAGTECAWYGVGCNMAGTNITTIVLDSNNLVGTLPATINNLAQLRIFEVDDNQISGALPALTGLIQLERFNARNNLLTGSIPALTGLSALQSFIVSNNQLTGFLPPVPNPTNALVAGSSSICPNPLTLATNAAWDAATGSTPWFNNCLDVGNFLVTPSASANGTMTPPDPQTVQPTETQSFIVTPNAGYVVGSVGGTCGAGSFSGNIYTTASIENSCTVIFNFVLAAAAAQNVAVPLLPVWALGLLVLLVATFGVMNRRGLVRPRR